MKKESKLDQILKFQKKEFIEQKKIEALEKKQMIQVKSIDFDEKEVETLERKQIKELEELKELDKKIKEEIGAHPLRKITYKDVGKSMIGAFIGIVSHYTILEGVHFAETISLTKANFFLLISFFVALIMLYYTGFRKVKDVRVFVLLPLRLFLIYAVTIIAILIVLMIFGSNELSAGIIYRQVAVLSLPAIIGACAADLIGGD